MNELPMHNYADIMALKPCYDPVKRGYITVDWRGNALDALRTDGVPAEDRLWLVLRDGWIPDDILQEFIFWCAEQVLALTPEPDPRSKAALEVKRRWLRGEATDEELDDAYYAARDAYSAARDAAYTAAYSASWAARDAYYAARAAYYAARDAAYSAAYSAAYTAAWAAYSAAYSAAYTAARASQVEQLITMLEAYEAEQ